MHFLRWRYTFINLTIEFLSLISRTLLTPEVFKLTICPPLLHLLIYFTLHVLRHTFYIELIFYLFAPVTLLSTLEVIILARTTNPATIRKIHSFSLLLTKILTVWLLLILLLVRLPFW